VLQEHKLPYYVDYEEGGDYAAACWSWSTERGKVDALRAHGEGPVLSVEDVRKALASVTALTDIKALIDAADAASGIDLPEFILSDAVRVHLGLPPVDPTFPVPESKSEPEPQPKPFANVSQYNDELDRLGIAPNGDDYNAIIGLLGGQPYQPPHTKGR
jgi:hypothetical protein